ncbi:hypothetical protein MUK42_03694 [Musa troglodytarum]|nr:hypothetical protein MUK42_03694 [Musa troglodytarum]
MVVSSVGLVRCGRELPWYQFLLYCFLLSGCTLVALSFGAHKSPLLAFRLPPFLTRR